MKRFYNVHTIWLAMIVLTLFTYGMGKIGQEGILVVFVLLLTVVIKGSLIIYDFMELKGVSLLWRVIMFGWLTTVCLAIAICYLISP